MPRLGEHIHALFTAPVVESLVKKSIFTAVDFIETNPEFLAKVTGLQYKKILQLREIIFSRFASSLCSGDRYYQELVDHCAIIPSGISKLDAMLGGGFTTGNIYELCGPSGCGKTQLCATISANQCISMPHYVIYVDTKNDITAHRLLGIIERHPNKVTDVGSVMSRVLLHSVRSAHQLLALLHTFSNPEGESPPYRLLIIDSLAALFYGFLGEQQSEGLNLLCHVSNMLHYIAVELHVAVLVTNLVTTWSPDVGNVSAEASTQAQRPALGRYWAHVPSTRIHMKQLTRVNEVLLTTVKSASQPVGKVATVTISDAGVL